jgi:hypothetical protein
VPDGGLPPLLVVALLVSVELAGSLAVSLDLADFADLLELP